MGIAFGCAITDKYFFFRVPLELAARSYGDYRQVADAS
jgi:hypothetical protein